MKDDWKVTELNDVVVKKRELSNGSVDIYLPYDEPSEDASWIIELARREEEIDQTGMISFDAVNSPEQVLKGCDHFLFEIFKELHNKAWFSFQLHKERCRSHYQGIRHLQYRS